MSVEILERLYRAMHQVQRDHIPLDNFVVRAHPSIEAKIKTDMSHISWVAHDGVTGTFAGLPFEVDPSLDVDGIVLRYEVVA